MAESLIPKGHLEELKALLRKAPNGPVVEVGVYRGGSALALSSELRGRELHLFDTFKGIPEKTPHLDGIDVGHFSDVSLDEVKALLPFAHFHVGFFPDTLPDDLTDLSFVHIDCDQYETCKNAIEKLWPRLLPGGVMAFDDYPFQGIKKAIHDYFQVEILFTELKIAHVIKKQGVN